MNWKITLTPIFIFLAYFAADKACLHPGLKKLTQADATYMYFDYKVELLDEIERVHKANQNPANYISGVRKKTIVILGSSRLLYFDTVRFHRAYPDWDLFNFSAPVTAPAYYAYILERILERGVKPDYVVIEADPLQYNDGADHFVRSNLAYSFDLPFVLRHYRLFKNSEISYFLSRLMFAGYKYPPDVKNLYERSTQENNQWLLALEELDRFQRANRGAGRSIIPRENWYERDYGRLELSARQSAAWVYGNFKTSQRQFEFLDLILRQLSENQISVLFLRPQVSSTLQRHLDTDEKLAPLLEAWNVQFKARLAPYGYPYLDLRHNKEIQCNTFVDAGHMSLDCYHMLTVAMMQERKASQ